jgi:signal peptide peptidase-like protein 2B
MYAPLKPSFDGAIPFLWMMAVGTVACASVWTVAVVGEEVHAHKSNQMSIVQSFCKTMREY